ncbi:MAG: polysaccharide biosynthesis protein [Gammaproteobacteria bacterium]|nr:polysaccharide biosynthesis protein [Gammaproteobacteria bacterium]
MSPAALRLSRTPSILTYATTLSRFAKRAIMISADIIAIPFCTVLAIWLVAPATGTIHDLWLLPLIAVVGLAFIQARGMYRSIVHFLGLEVLVHAMQSAVGTAIVFGSLTGWLSTPLVGLKLGLCFGLLMMCYVAGSRVGMRLLLRARHATGDRVLIYGAGEAGAHLATALTERADFVPVGFVDDNASLHGTVINSLEVNAPATMRELVDRLDVSRVLLALPSVTRRRRRQIIDHLEELPVHVQTMPDIADLISGHARLDEIREVDVADLLGRDAVPPMAELLHACIRGKSVMVTGAGGSIGAELCRHICQLSPNQLILLEISEVALYAVHREITEMTLRDKLDVEVIPILASVHHRWRVQSVCETFGVQTIYHAAAYKHVPLVEHNMLEGIHNNVFGTLHTAEAAIKAGVNSFVLVSTDKAVQPTNVMGATKRLAELVLQALGKEHSDTVFSMVRFGNVLESSGSVVPLFRDQIRKSGPVTVTHPNIYRYFMTIPEAAELVIQAGSMARGGDVFVLDMGKPVRIADLAEKMIHLMGLSVRDEEHPDGDIEIVYTGLRPAEKLYEELLIGTNACGTNHSMIMRAVEDYLPWPELKSLLDELWNACMQLDCARGRELLLQGVGEYEPSVGLVDHVWTERQSAAAVADLPSKVTELRPGAGGVTGKAS